MLRLAALRQARGITAAVRSGTRYPTTRVLQAPQLLSQRVQGIEASFAVTRRSIGVSSHVGTPATVIHVNTRSTGAASDPLLPHTQQLSPRAFTTDASDANTTETTTTTTTTTTTNSNQVPVELQEYEAEYIKCMIHGKYLDAADALALLPKSRIRAILGPLSLRNEPELSGLGTLLSKLLLNHPPEEVVRCMRKIRGNDNAIATTIDRLATLPQCPEFTVESPEYCAAMLYLYNSPRFPLMEFLTTRPYQVKERTVRLLLSQIPAEEGYKDLCAAIWVSTGLKPGRIVHTNREEYLWPLVREKIIPNLDHIRTLVEQAVQVRIQRHAAESPKAVGPGPYTNLVPHDDRTYFPSKPKRFVDTLLRILSQYTVATGDGTALCRAIMTIPADTPLMCLWAGSLQGVPGNGLVSAREALESLLKGRKRKAGAPPLSSAERLKYVQSNLRISDIAMEGQYEGKQMGVVGKAVSGVLAAECPDYDSLVRTLKTVYPSLLDDTCNPALRHRFWTIMLLTYQQRGDWDTVSSIISQRPLLDSSAHTWVRIDGYAVSEVAFDAVKLHKDDIARDLLQTYVTTPTHKMFLHEYMKMKVGRREKIEFNNFCKQNDLAHLLPVAPDRNKGTSRQKNDSALPSESGAEPSPPKRTVAARGARRWDKFIDSMRRQVERGDIEQAAGALQACTAHARARIPDDLYHDMLSEAMKLRSSDLFWNIVVAKTGNQPWEKPSLVIEACYSILATRARDTLDRDQLKDMLVSAATRFSNPNQSRSDIDIMATVVYCLVRMNDIRRAKSVFRECVEQEMDETKKQLVLLNGRAALAIGLRGLATAPWIKGELGQEFKGQSDRICDTCHVPKHEKGDFVSGYLLQAMMVSARNRNSPDRAHAAVRVQGNYDVRYISPALFYDAMDIIGQGTPEVPDRSGRVEVNKARMLGNVLYSGINSLKASLSSEDIELERNRLYQAFARVLLTMDRYDPQPAGHYRQVLDKNATRIGPELAKIRPRSSDPEAHVRLALAFINQAILHQRWDLAYRLAPLVWQDGRIGRPECDIPFVTELLPISSLQQLLARTPDHAISKPVVCALHRPEDIRGLIDACRNTPAMEYLIDVCQASKGEMPLVSPLVLYNSGPRAVKAASSTAQGKSAPFSWPEFDKIMQSFVDCSQREDLSRQWANVVAAIPIDRQIPYERTRVMYNHALRCQQPALALTIMVRYIDFVENDEEATNMFFNFLNVIVNRSLYKADPSWVGYVVLQAVSHMLELRLERSERTYAKLFNLLGRTQQDKKFSPLLQIINARDPQFRAPPYRENGWWGAYGLGSAYQSELKLNNSGDKDKEALATIGHLMYMINAVRDMQPDQPLADLSFALHFHPMVRMFTYTNWDEFQAELDASPFTPTNLTWYHGLQLACAPRIARKSIDMHGVSVCFGNLTAALPPRADLLGKQFFTRANPAEPVNPLDNPTVEDLWFRAVTPVSNAFTRYRNFSEAAKAARDLIPQLDASASKGETLYRQLFFAALGMQYVQQDLWEDAVQALEQALPMVLDPSRPLNAELQGTREQSALSLFFVESLFHLAENHCEQDLGPWLLQQLRTYQGYDDDILAIQGRLPRHYPFPPAGLHTIIARLRQSGGGALKHAEGADQGHDDLEVLLDKMTKVMNSEK